ncbi:hypothetical protein LTR95_007408 [Oleoguttula sp. CCFEE 5521]
MLADCTIQGIFDNVATQTLARNDWNQLMGQVANQITLLERAGHSASGQRAQLLAMQQSAAQGAALQASRSGEDLEQGNEDSEGGDDQTNEDEETDDVEDDDEDEESDGDE